jgi:predicted nucleic acid-binding protein
LKPRRTPTLREPAAAYLPDAFVIDCSVCLPWYIEDEASEFCARLAGTLGRADIWVPPLWRPEFASAVINAEHRRRMTADRRRAILASAAGLPLRVDNDTPTVTELGYLASAHDLTPYDALYFELARRRKLPLATLDAALVKAARAVKLPLITDLSVFPER